MMRPIEAQQLIQQIQTMRASGGMPVHTEKGVSHFANTLNNALSMVNNGQIESQNLSERFERGENVSLAQAMIATKKSEIGFQAMVEVRNRMVGAYQEIMNMPV
jgi:flagellar hook-basal body complex protein FliE